MLSDAGAFGNPVLLALSTLAAAGQTNGIYADFTTTRGSFTCQLNYTNAPRTTANFIGLATGQRAWLDLTTGRARTNAFYNGLIFHRVIAGFMNQGGSPNGMGTDGPGYVIKDEFSRYLVFTNFGVLAMANSGPNSAGFAVLHYRCQLHLREQQLRHLRQGGIGLERSMGDQPCGYRRE